MELNFDKSTHYVALWTHKRLTPFRASYGVSFMSTLTEIDRVIKGFYCNAIQYNMVFCTALLQLAVHK